MRAMMEKQKQKRKKYFCLASPFLLTLPFIFHSSTPKVIYIKVTVLMAFFFHTLKEGIRGIRYKIRQRTRRRI